jgi:uncharacterized protein (DUF362 family)
MDRQVIKIEVKENLKEAIKQAVDGLGGFGRFVAPGDKVLLKPNWNTSHQYPGSSDREFVGLFADLCHEAGAGEVTVGDASTVFLITANVMKKWGSDKLLDGRPWLKIVDLSKGKYVKKDVPNGKYLKTVSMPELLYQVDKVFILPCLKTHSMAQYTGAIKIAVGILKRSERWLMHADHLQEKIAEINAVYKPDLIVMDARKCFITGGPMTGTVRELGLVMASTDRIAIDLEGVKIIQSFEGNSLVGVKPEELPQIKRALELGIDRTDASVRSFSRD